MKIEIKASTYSTGSEQVGSFILPQFAYSYQLYVNGKMYGEPMDDLQAKALVEKLKNTLSEYKIELPEPVEEHNEHSNSPNSDVT